MRTVLFALVAVSAMILDVSAQKNESPLLERTVTLSLVNEPLASALKKIGQAGNVTFSYKSNLFDDREPVTARFANNTIREVLDRLFKGDIMYKERGRYIILVKAERKVATAEEPAILSGYVVDEATGERLRSVSVYDPITLSSAVTDKYGFFTIEIKNPTGEEVRLAVNKNRYTDTLVVVPSGNRRLLNVPLRISKEKIAVVADSVGTRLRRFWLSARAATQQASNMENIDDTLYRDWQVSLVPFVGRNGKLSGNVINDFSLNIFGGYSLGIRKAEFGGLFNIVRGDMNGVQAAGLFNGTLGDQRGIQFAGLANATLGIVEGPQFAGLANLSASGYRSVSAAGLVNLSLKYARGPAFAGLGNLTIGTHRGPTVAGLFNLTTGDGGPAQVAGLFNFTAHSTRGAQTAGVFNFSGSGVKGAQVAGIMNVAAKSVHGAQIAGVFNFAREVNGTQVGLFNVTREIKGVPVGLLSIVGKGYHKLEFSADEVFLVNVAFRTGVRQFYNIITAGASPGTFGDAETLWTFGYGLGTAPRLTKWLYANIDVTANQVVHGGEVPAVNLINKLYGGFDFQLAKNFSVTAGITLNAQVTDLNYTGYPDLFRHFTPEIIEERVFSDDVHVRMWLGGKVGLRFF